MHSLLKPRVNGHASRHELIGDCDCDSDFESMDYPTRHHIIPIKYLKPSSTSRDDRETIDHAGTGTRAFLRDFRSPGNNFSSICPTTDFLRFITAIDFTIE